MADVELIVKIPHSLYANLSKIQRGSIASKKILECVCNGTPLPKGHGRLIDVDELIRQYKLDEATKYGNKNAKQQAYSYSTMMLYEIADMIDDAPTIIEADGLEVWNGIHAQITAPKGTFKKIWNEADKGGEE